MISQNMKGQIIILQTLGEQNESLRILQGNLLIM